MTTPPTPLLQEGESAPANYEQTAMFTVVDLEGNAWENKTATFSEIEKLLPILLRGDCFPNANNAILPTLLPVQVLAIGINHEAQRQGIDRKWRRGRDVGRNACQRLTCRIVQCRWSRSYLLCPLDALYVTMKEWSQEEKNQWEKSTVYERRHICSFESTWDWDLETCKILCVAVVLEYKQWRPFDEDILITVLGESSWAGLNRGQTGNSVYLAQCAYDQQGNQALFLFAPHVYNEAVDWWTFQGKHLISQKDFERYPTFFAQGLRAYQCSTTEAFVTAFELILGIQDNEGSHWKKEEELISWQDLLKRRVMDQDRP